MPRKCRALLDLAAEQLAETTPHEANVSRLLHEHAHQQSGLVACVHRGQLFYQLNSPRMKHAWHGDVDRPFGTLQSVFQTVLATRYRGTKCFQFSGRDDQKQNILGIGDGFGLPAMLWHISGGLSAKNFNASMYEHIEASVVPWPSSYVPDEQAAAAQQARAHFLWPEHNYFGELVRQLPPIPNLHGKLVEQHAQALPAPQALPPSLQQQQPQAANQARRRPPEPFSPPAWEDRSDLMRYRGSPIGLTRQHVLSCSRYPQSLPARTCPRDSNPRAVAAPRPCHL